MTRSVKIKVRFFDNLPQCQMFEMLNDDAAVEILLHLLLWFLLCDVFYLLIALLVVRLTILANLSMYLRVVFFLLLHLLFFSKLQTTDFSSTVHFIYGIQFYCRFVRFHVVTLSAFWL